MATIARTSKERRNGVHILSHVCVMVLLPLSWSKTICNLEMGITSIEGLPRTIVSFQR